MPLVLIGFISAAIWLLIGNSAENSSRNEQSRDLADTNQAVALIPVSPFGCEGVIFPKVRAHEAREAIDGYWTPSASDVEMLERQLPEFLRTQYSAYGVEKVSTITAYLPKYRRQYVGILEDGSRQIFVNFLLPNDPLDKDWRRNFVVVTDGGFYYWRVYYNLDRQQFHHFSVNGDA